jgi:hypothetical protein
MTFHKRSILGRPADGPRASGFQALCPNQRAAERVFLRGEFWRRADEARGRPLRWRPLGLGQSERRSGVASGAGPIGRTRPVS